MTSQPAPVSTPATAATPSTEPDTGAPASVEFKTRDDIKVDPADWEKRAADVRAGLAKDGMAESQMFDALLAFRFTDAAGTNWSYNGTAWLSWNGQTWTAATPPSELKLQPFTFDLVPEPPDQPPAGITTLVDADMSAPAATLPPTQAAAAAPPEQSTSVAVSPTPATAATPIPSATPAPAPAPGIPPVPTRVTPPRGLPAWAQPDPSSAQVFLAPGLPLAVAEVLPNGWARVVASNGWTGWVNGAGLLPIGGPP